MNIPSQALIDIIGNLDSWRRKLLEIGNSYYICLPKQVVRTAGKKKGDFIEIRRSVDAKSGKLIMVINV
jgi:hypothetical protein